MAYDSHAHVDLQKYASLIDLIETAAERYGDKTAYVCLGKASSFADIERDSRYFAAYLQQHTQLEVGDKVAIQLPNITQFVIAAYGALRAGMILVNTNPLYTQRELIHQYRDSDAKALVVLSDLLPTLETVIPETQIETVISTHPLDLIATQPQADSQLAHIGFNQVLALGSQAEYRPVEVAQQSLAALQYTGGTTGLSKGAMLSHSNLLANMLQVQSRLASKFVEGEEIFIAPLPIYHIYAFMVNFVYFEQGGCSVLIPNPRDISALIQTMSQHPFTGFAGLNTLFVGLCHQQSFQALDFSHLKITISDRKSVV